MHILIIPSWYPKNASDIGGSFFREQAIALQKRGHNIGVISPQYRSLRNWKSIFTGKYGLDINIDENVPTYRIHNMRWFASSRLANFEASICNFNGLNAFEKYIKEYGKPDIIHVQSALYGGVIALSIANKFNIPYVVTEHSSLYVRNLLNPIQKKISIQINSKAKKRIAVSESFSCLLERYHNHPELKWEYIPNIVSDNFLEYENQNQKKAKCFTFLTICLLNKNKAIDNLIQSFAIALKITPDIKLNIGGYGPELENLKQLTKTLKVESQVSFLGALSRTEVIDKISESNVFVSSSKNETFGVVLVEALALGKPVIATRSGGPESIVREKDGILVPVDNPEAMASAMLKIINNQESYDPIEIKNSCQKRFSEQAVVQRLIELYSQVISS